MRCQARIVNIWQRRAMNAASGHVGLGATIQLIPRSTCDGAILVSPLPYYKRRSTRSFPPKPRNNRLPGSHSFLAPVTTGA